MSFSNASALDGIPRETLLPALGRPDEILSWAENFRFRMMEARRDWYDAIMRLRSGDMLFIAPKADFTPSLGTHLANKTYVDAAVAAGAGVPTGMILPYGGSAVPSGYLACNGAAVSRVTYSALFSAIGVLWGPGDGATTFNVPDIQRRYLMGKGSAPWDTVGTTDGGAEAAREPATHGHANTLATGNESAHTHAVGTLATGAGSAHKHGTSGLSISDESTHTHSAGSHTHGVSGNTGDAGGHSHALQSYSMYGLPGGSVYEAQTDTVANHNHGVSITSAASGGATGAGSAHHHDISGGDTDNESAHTHGVSGATAAGAAHNHSVSGAVTDKSTWPPHGVALYVIKT